MEIKKRNLVLTLTIALLLFVSIAFGAVLSIFIDSVRAQGNEEVTLIGGEIEEKYLLNDVIEIPAAKISYGGETKTAEISVITPSGERVRSAKLKLTEGGQHKAEYKALFGGKAKTVEKTFVVEIPLFSTATNKTTWSYGVDDSQYQTGKEGVMVRLAKGDTLTYNDIIDLRKNNGQIIDFFLLPADGIGTKDLKRLTITLTDLYDPNIQLTIILQCANDHGTSDKWWFNPTYVLAGGQNQIPTGVEGKGTEKEKVWVGGDWGSVVTYSFYGMHTYGNGEAAVGKESLNVSYNEDKNAVYVNGSEIIGLSNLKYFEDPWEGFTTGEVKMSIVGEGYSLGSANIMITRINANDLTQKFFVDDAAPEIDVDFGAYDENNLPTAGKGLSYPAFEATAFDKVFGSVNVKTTVYYNYESKQRYQVDIKDGRFATDATGYYTIEYLAYDGFKNENKKLVTVYCGESTPALTVSAADEYATVGATGEMFFPAEIGYVGGTGEVKTYATAKVQLDVEEFVIDEGFRPEKEGVYTITLYAVDMLGKTATFIYDLTVSVNDNPVFLDTAILPKFFLTGYNYNLPILPAYDYSSGTEKVQIGTTIIVKDGKEGEQVRDLPSNVADFVADADGYATVIYKAVGAKGENTVEYKVKVIDTWRDMDNYSLDMKKYFYGENIEITDNEKSIEVSALTDTSYTFINPVIANGFETKFSIVDGGFACLQIVLEDSKDPSLKFTLELDKADLQDADTLSETALLRINGKAVKCYPAANFYNGNEFYFVYNEFNKSIQLDCLTDNGKGEVVKGLFRTTIMNEDGSTFAGFTSGTLYMTVNVIGVESGAKVSWRNIARQILSERDYDIIAPSIKLSNNYASKYSIGTVAEVYSAVVADVLSPEVYTTMTVRDPSGKVVTDVDGVKLENVSFDRPYFINLEMYGSYSVKYTAIDWMECTQDYSFAILVVDDQAPEITLDKELKTEIKQGKTIKISTATAQDNVDGEVDVYAYLVDPSGVIRSVTMGEKVELTMKGVYQIRYMAIDAFGNLKILYYDVNVG